MAGTNRVRSRRHGEGSVTSYTTKSGTRYRWQLHVPIDPEKPELGTRQAGKAGYADPDIALEDLGKARKQKRQHETFAVGRAPKLSAFAVDWLAGLNRDELAPSTIQGYEKIVRLHIVPELGSIDVDKITATRIARHYQELRESGRRDSRNMGKPLSANSVNKVSIVLGAILEAVMHDGYRGNNPARDRRIVKAPTGKTIRAQRPEIETWTAAEMGAFMDWNRDIFDDDLHALWATIAGTGMRRSEALALRWGDLAGNRISVRRAADVTTRNAVKSTKTDRPRVVDIDDDVLAVLKGYKALRGSISLDLARTGAYMFGNLAGEVRSPNEVSRRWAHRVGKAREHLGADELKRITLKGLRHTHATLLLELGVPLKVVAERLGHTEISTTANIYSHVSESMQQSAVQKLAAAVSAARNRPIA